MLNCLHSCHSHGSACTAGCFPWSSPP